MTTSVDETTIPAETEAQLRAVLDRVYAAWAANDADAFVADYRPDAVTLVAGLLGETSDIVRDRMVDRFAGPLKGSHVVDEIETIRPIGGGNAAVVVARSGIVLAGKAEAPAETWVWATWTLSRQDGRWLVASYHNSPVPPSTVPG